MNDITLQDKLFGTRQNATWLGYIPILLVLTGFVVLGVINRGLLRELYLVVLLLIAAIQVRFRTLIGWIVLLTCAIAYSVVALYQVALVLISGTTANNAQIFSLLLLACGVTSATALFFSRPWKAKHSER
jgi:hypothetical protein